MAYVSYMRRVAINYSYWNRILNLPDGFQVVGLHDDAERAAYVLMIACPHRPEFAVHEGELIPEVYPYVRQMGDGRFLTFTKEFGQAEPQDD